ncbi:hypothetical protein SYNPS1DRAFT_30088 [Syncephalis pseudoplumigaleata]|uniref:Calcium-dependent phosphotriesterase n=1 Tax=Syncephalis pseudoplumigaleata TaxID=1712513 RepID=A0A4P9YVP7_9FUNG|nr:hypothetical protein SYNPS1DRAFT_30088 [Syncephalis pseudoplumigaleata]|eukprot:RKP24143.1 hypothetical protein SYNPS1DRAFT_30088 [Syncephalis pseudoplumigaleata]
MHRLPPRNEADKISASARSATTATLSRSAIIGVLFAVVLSYTILPYYVTLFRTLNLGRTITPLNTDRCNHVVHPRVEGCEDMVVDHAAGIVYMACGSVENRLRWWPPLDHHDRRNLTDEQDPIFIYHLKTGKLEALPIAGFDGELHLHGIALWKPGPDGLAATTPLTAADPPAVLMLINHAYTGSTIEIFEHILPSTPSTSGVGVLRHVETVKDPLIHAPNSVHPVSRRSFYVTNDHRFHRGALRMIEQVGVLPISNVIFRDEDGTSEVVASNIAYPNGIIGYHDDNYILVVASTMARIYVYRRNTHNNQLTLHGYVSTAFTGDNLRMDFGTGRLYIAGTMQPLNLLKKTYDTTVEVASQVARVDNLNVGDIAKGIAPSADITPLVIYDKYPGSALTVAAVDAKHQKMLLSGFFADGILVCDLL